MHTTSTRPAALLLALGVLLAGVPAPAHEGGLSYLELEAEGATVKAVLDAPPQDYVRTLRLDADRDGQLSPADLAASEGNLKRWLFGSLRFVVADRLCAPDTFTARLEAQALLRLTGTWRCEATADTLHVASQVLDTFGDDHTIFVRAARGEAIHQALLTAKDSEVTFDFGVSESRLSAAWRFVVLGVEHIFTGIDHVMFVLALLLLGGSLRRIIGVATAFTAAHSVTLSLAALDLVVLPSRLVESVIALSIGWVAVENYVFARPRVEGVAEPAVLRWRWLLTFAFGLLHGFGFAGVLGDLGLPKGHEIVALASFNVGVELGQVAIIAAAYPLLRKALQTRWYRPHAVRAASALMLVVAVYWFVQRAFDLG